MLLIFWDNIVIFAPFRVNISPSLTVSLVCTLNGFNEDRTKKHQEDQEIKNGGKTLNLSSRKYFIVDFDIVGSNSK